MAKGDVVSEIASLAANAYLTYQPAAETETMITGFTNSTVLSGVFDRLRVEFLDGTNITIFGDGTIAPNSTFKIFVNNAHYMRTKANGEARIQGYFGVQTK